MLQEYKEAKLIPNALTREECARLIEQAENFEYDILKKDIVEQDVSFDKATLDANTIERNYDDSSPLRKVSQSPMEPVFPEWDGNPVYRCKVMKYEVGEYVKPHKDAQWMCLSNYWAPNTNLSSESLVTIPLNDNFEGGEFTVAGEVVPQEVGQAIQVNCDPFSPETSPVHGVKTVTEGTRYALVFWNFS
tara:strand:+ start:3658 stop:4227 length:570 start_codon:yes stop_codon:yes gene_type:complete